MHWFSWKHWQCHYLYSSYASMSKDIICNSIEYILLLHFEVWMWCRSFVLFNETKRRLVLHNINIVLWLSSSLLSFCIILFTINDRTHSCIADGAAFVVKRKKSKSTWIIMNAFQFSTVQTIMDAFSVIRSKSAIECAHESCYWYLWSLKQS